MVIIWNKIDQFNFFITFNDIEDTSDVILNKNTVFTESSEFYKKGITSLCGKKNPGKTNHANPLILDF